MNPLGNCSVTHGQKHGTMYFVVLTRRNSVLIQTTNHMLLLMFCMTAEVGVDRIAGLWLDACNTEICVPFEQMASI